MRAAAGTPTGLLLKVSRKGRRVLKAATTRGRGAIEATFTDDLGATSADSSTVRFKLRH